MTYGKIAKYSSHGTVRLSLAHRERSPLTNDDSSGVDLGIPRQEREVSLEFSPDTACAYRLMIESADSRNASADGSNVIVNSGLIRFAQSDDELAVAVAHEIAHNAMGHLNAQAKNRGSGALLGAIVDVASATYGVNTGREYAKAGAAAGARAFSQDFEREADYLGTYILAAAGRPIVGAANFWRRKAREDPQSI